MGWHPSAALLMLALLSVFWREEYSAHCGVSRALASAIPMRNVDYLLIERDTVGSKSIGINIRIMEDIVTNFYTPLSIL